MARITSIFNNFASGKIDHDVDGRFDLPLYKNGADVFTNFISNFKGNAIYRSGFKLVEEFEDCVFVEFKFSKEQSYLCLFYENKVKFLTYDAQGNLGFVLDGSSNVYELASPYTLEQARTIQWAQNADVMKIVHTDVVPQDFKRLTANTFSFTPSTTTGIDWGTTFGYPTSVLFKDGRLYFSRITTVWGSEAGDYEEFTVPTSIVADSPFTVTIADVVEPISWLKGSDNAIILGNSENIIALGGGGVDTPLTASNVFARITGVEGSDTTIPISKDNLLFYIGSNSRNVFYFAYELLSESYKANDGNFISYDITRQGVKKLKFKKDRDDLIYTVTNDGKLLSLNFKQQENINGWSLQETDGLIQDIATISDQDGNTQLFTLVKRNGSYYIEILSPLIEFSKREDFFTDDEKTDFEAYNRKLGEELKECIFLDNSQCVNNLKEINITYSNDQIVADSAVFSAGDVDKFIVYKTKTGYEKGRFKITNYVNDTTVDVEVIIAPSQNTYDLWYLTFTSLTALDRFNGTEVSVVADGSYIGEFPVTSGNLEIDRAATSLCIGLRYTGTIKTFSLGVVGEGVSTQQTQKSIFEVGVRAIETAGGLVGSTPYRLEPIQDLKQGDINYLPTTLIDNTKMVQYVDNSQRDKYLYIVQDKPLPMRLTCLIVNCKHGMN